MTHDDMCDLCVEMWNEMIENGYTKKSQSRLVSYFDPIIKCFACEFYDACEKCEFSKYNGCLSTKSAFSLWIKYKKISKEQSKQYMIEICDLFV